MLNGAQCVNCVKAQSRMAECENGHVRMIPDPTEPADLRLPPAKVRMTRVALGGLALWAVALAVVLATAQPHLYRDICLAGLGLGGLFLAWSLWSDRRRRV